MLDYIAIAKAEGATRCSKVRPIDLPGHFVGPQLFTGVEAGMRIEQEL